MGHVKVRQSLFYYELLVVLIVVQVQGTVIFVVHLN